MVTRHGDTEHEFSVFLRHARRVELRADFTRWGEDAVPLEPEGDGWWRTRRPVGPGDHKFVYLIDGARWLADYAASGVQRDDLGGWVSLLHVPQERSSRAAA